MVAFSGADPVAVLIGAKRPCGTLVHKIAVHPDHQRQGHGRHLLASLGSKLAILGPPRMVAEVPAALATVQALLRASGYVEEALLTDYVLQLDSGGSKASDQVGRSSRAPAGFVIPVTVDDLAANGLLDEAHLQVCWERSLETLMARKDEIRGLAVASDERIEAYVLYVGAGVNSNGNDDPAHRDTSATAEILSLCTFVEDEGARLSQLLARIRLQGVRTLRFPKVHPAEVLNELVEALGFLPAVGHLRYAATAQSA